MTPQIPADPPLGRIGRSLEAVLRGASRYQLFTLTAAIIVLAAILGAVALQQLRTQVLGEGERLTASYAHIIEEQTTRTLQAVELRMTMAADEFGHLVQSGRLNEATGHELMVAYAKGLPYVRSMWVMDAQGRLVHDSDTGNIGINLSDREYFKIFLNQPKTPLYIGNPVRSRTNGKWLIAMSRALRNERGEFTGILVAALETEHFNSLWRDVDLGDTGAIALFQRSGELMMRTPADDNAMGRRFTELPLFAGLEKSPNGSFYNTSPFDGNRRMYSYRSLTAFPNLIIIVGHSVDRVLASWRHFVFLSTVLWALGSAAIGLLSLILSRTLAQKERTRAAGEKIQQRMALATDAAGIAVWEWDLITDEWTVTPTFFTMRGLDAAQGMAAPMSWLDGVHPDDRTVVATQSDALRNGTAPQPDYEARWLHADGSYRWIRVIARDFSRNPSGKPNRLLGVTLDITVRKNAEAALKESEERYRVLVDLSPYAISVHQNETIVFANKAALQMFGAKSSEDLVGQKIEKLLDPESLEGVRSRLQRMLSGETGVYPIETQYTRVDGSSIEVEASGATCVFNGRPAIQFVTLDITARKRAQAELQASLHEKEFLLREVHHRVKNNLQVITSLLRLESNRSLQPDSKRVLSDMQHRIRTMALLHESLYKSGAFAAVALDAYLKDLASQAFRAMVPPGRDIQLKLDLASVRIGMEQAAPCGLLVNELISNSLKHGFPMPQTGEVRVELSLLEDSRRICLKVSDTGVGLPEAFETRRKASLGLQLVSDLAHQLGGELQVGPGAAFTVTFTPQT